MEKEHLKRAPLCGFNKLITSQKRECKSLSFFAKAAEISGIISKPEIFLTKLKYRVMNSVRKSDFVVYGIRQTITILNPITIVK